MTESTSPAAARGRILALDALRLMAALVVFGHHFHVMFGLDLPFYLSNGLLDAKGAVTLFFVLSGYVLALSLSREAPSPRAYVNFGVRRVFRLYPLYWAALVFTLGVMVWIQQAGGFAQTPELRASFLEGQGLQWRQWVLQATLVAPGMKSFFANPPVWTLMTEAKVAPVFPLLAWALLRMRWEGALVLLGALVLGSGWLHEHVAGTAAFLGQFGLGVFLCRVPQEFWRSLSRSGWGWLGTGSGLLYCVISIRHLIPVWVSFYACAFGAAGLVACASHCGPFRATLNRWQARLGVDLSYAVYVLHYPILIGLRKMALLGWLAVPPLGLFFVALALTLGLSFVLHHLIEVPAIQCGRQLTKRRGRSASVPAPVL
ncbi:acyltransferase family protein [Prosthecobacter sp.]|uniref:acyltransferase family protein n=1 Tax=Prosthecobacter sp. TaxID=1965333 RepID=UPI003784E655